MFITVHAAAATAIAKNIPNPFIAFICGFLSHFLLDIPPHGDTKLGKKFLGLKLSEDKHKEDIRPLALLGTLDSFSLAILILYLFRNFDFVNADSVVWAIIGGILPDVIMVTYKLTKFKPLYLIEKWHQKNHYLLLNRLKGDIPFKYGLIFQGCVLALLIVIIHAI